ncbi:MAG TPA: thioredoxin domain-containing protein [Rhizomicrobium sp.]
MTRKQLLYGVVGIAVIALLVGAWFVFYGGGGSSSESESADRANVTVSQSDRTLGNKNAPITMVEYAAPSCPHCSHFNEAMFPQLKANYIDTGKVYYIFRVFPLSSVDVAVEAMARCLPANNYFQFIDLMFRNQPKWDPDGYQIPDVHGALVEMGRIAGMSAEQVDRCIGNQAEQQRITKVGEDAQTRYSVNGTPTFITNGQIHSTFANYQELKDYLDAQLKKK